MNVASKHVNSRLRITDPERKVIKTFNRIRPTLAAGDASALRQAVMLVTTLPVSGALFTITTELVEE